jgi:hypothetical protein
MVPTFLATTKAAPTTCGAFEDRKLDLLLYEKCLMQIPGPWADKLKELTMTYEYSEMPGVDHDSIIEEELPSIYAVSPSTLNRRSIDAN